MTNIAELIKHSIHIQPMKVGPINNKYGRYWQSMPDIIFALTSLRARTGSFNDPWGSPKDPLFAPPPLIFINDRLSDLLDQRAIELNKIAKLQNRRILIMWSGGIDSTGVVAAFLKNLSAQDLDNVSILLTINSIGENTDFYVNHIAGKIHCMPYLEYVVNEENINKYMLLHGDPGDCLFGPSTVMFSELVPTGEHNKLFKNNLSLIANSIDRKSLKTIKRLGVDGFSKWYTNKIADNLIEVAPEGVETISDFWWWHYYNFKWEFSIWRHLFRRKVDGFETEPLSGQSVHRIVEHTFFNTNQFQQWSYSNLRSHIGKDLSNHKMELKRYIYDLDRNDVYLTHKTKMESTPAYNQASMVQLHRPMLWDKNWVGYYQDYPHLKSECISMLESYKG